MGPKDNNFLYFVYIGPFTQLLVFTIQSKSGKKFLFLLTRNTLHVIFLSLH